MSTFRPPTLQTFLSATEAALLAAAEEGSALQKAARRVFDRSRACTGKMTSGIAERLPVCRSITEALDASTAPADVVAALRALETSLSWTRRSSATPAQPAFWNGHANAMIIGPGGLEERKDIWIGASLMAPHVTYGDHNHSPEEVYLALTDGEWWNERMDWTSPGPGGLIYNPPGITHNMRAGTGPLLALWFLPV